MLKEFINGFISCALWLADDEPGSGEWQEHGLYVRSNIDDNTLNIIIEDCMAFWARHLADIGSRANEAGHDFYLTRNGHGAGFWDGDWPEDVGQTLTAASKVFGEFALYLGDDNKLYSY